MTNKKNKKIFIGVAWPYVNGDIHPGHLAGYLFPADITARFHRATGNDVLMVSGSDCFGTPITLEADKEGVRPEEIAEKYHKNNSRLLLKVLNLTYDLYTRTDTEHHIRVVQDVFLKLLERGFIFKDRTKQFYSPKKNKYLPDRYVIGKCARCGHEEARSDQCDQCGSILEQNEIINPKSKLSNEKVILKDTEHYFIDWRKLQPRIEKYVRAHGPLWKNWVYRESIGWLESNGLKPRAITRDIDWGVPIPIEKIPEDMRIDNTEHKRVYVWFDAVIGYLSASLLWSKQGKGDWRDFWYNPEAVHYYFMGKDNLIFHTLFWPGQLMGYDEKLHLPNLPSVNMFLNYDGKQFSKSRDITIDVEDMISRFGENSVRFYFTLIMPEAKDSSFRWQDFVDKNNQILVANLGNFIHRVLSIAQSGNLGLIKKEKLSSENADVVSMGFKRSRDFLENCQFRNYLDIILGISDYGNKLVDQEKLWTLKKENFNKFNAVLGQLYPLIITLGFLIYPLLPRASEELAKTLEAGSFAKWPRFGEEIKDINKIFQSMAHLSKPQILFKKIEITEIKGMAK